MESFAVFSHPIESSWAASASSSTSFLLYVTKNEIRRLVPNGTSSSSSLITSGLKQAVSLDYDYINSHHQIILFWSDLGQHKIQRAVLDVNSFNGDSTFDEDSTARVRVEDVITSDIESPDTLAVDWLGKKVYWTDSGRKSIEVANYEGTMRRVLYDYGLEMPSAIVVAPFHG